MHGYDSSILQGFLEFYNTASNLWIFLEFYKLNMFPAPVEENALQIKIYPIRQRLIITSRALIIKCHKYTYDI